MSGDAVVGRVWDENKLGARFHAGQIDRYGEALRAKQRLTSARGHEHDVALIGILGASPAAADAAAAQRAGMKLLRWQDIAELADAVGRGGGSTWRTDALDAHAHAGERLLAEFIWYLEDWEGLAVTRALTDDDNSLLDRVERTLGAFEGLLARSAQQLGSYEPDGKTEWGDFDECAQLLSGPGWWSTLDAYLTLFVSGDDAWGTEPTGAPAFGLALSLPHGDADFLVEDAAWMDGIAGDGFKYYDDPDRGWDPQVARQLPVSEVVEHVEFASQVAALSQFARDALDALVQREPSDLSPETPVRKRRGS